MSVSQVALQHMIELAIWREEEWMEAFTDGSAVKWGHYAQDKGMRDGMGASVRF